MARPTKPALDAVLDRAIQHLDQTITLLLERIAAEEAEIVAWIEENPDTRSRFIHLPPEVNERLAWLDERKIEYRLKTFGERFRPNALEIFDKTEALHYKLRWYNV